MRLSGLVVAALLFVSATLLAQHSSGGGGSSSGGSSHGSSSSGISSSSGSSHVSSSHVSSPGGSGSSHGSGRVSSSARAGSNARTHTPKSSSSAKPEKKGFFSFLRHRKPAPKPSLEAEANRPVRCKKGENCTCLAGGTRNAAGTCFSQAQVLCSAGLVWNGFGCGARYFVNDCSALAARLAQQERQMRSAMTSQQQSCSRDSASPECADLQGQSGRENLLYRQLLEQYNQCMEHSHAYAFRGEPLLGSSWMPRDDN